jgi:type III secretion protein J
MTRRHAFVCHLGSVLFFVLGCSIPIQHGLDEAAANEVVTSLERAGVGATKARDEGGELFIVSVSRADTIRALEVMRSLGLPRSQRSGFGEIYKQPSLVPTPTEERARYVEALAGEIERTLETVDGIVRARVHLVLPEADPLAIDGKPRIAAQAAVLLKTRAGHPGAIPESDVQKLIAGSVPGLAQAAVAVVVTDASERPAVPGERLVSFGPMRMTASSRNFILAVGGLACLLLTLLSGLLLLLVRRLAAAQHQSG